MAGKQERLGAALVVGVGGYAHDGVTALPCAVHDAQAVARLLVDPEVCRFPREKVKLLTDAKARRDGVVRALSRWLPEAARGAEVLLFFFAGHGAVGRVGAGEEGYLMPHDADPDDLVTRGIAMRDVARWVEGVDARAVVVCLDCCHAGRVLPRSGNPLAVPRNMGLRPSALPAMTGKGRILIASCDEGEYSLEAAELGHGLFTYHLLRGLEGAADRDRDGRVGVSELFEHVSAAVTRESRAKYGLSQTPWKTGTETAGVYLSTVRPGAVKTGSGAAALRERWRTGGAAAGVAEAERLATSTDPAVVVDVVRVLREKADPAGVPLLFRLLAHPAKDVWGRARAVLLAMGWKKVCAAALDCARRADPTRHGWLLDGLRALKAHADGVALLDHLAQVLQGDPRNRAILLLERKRLALTLDATAALFREHHIPYRLVRVLGQGLHAAAYLARHDGAEQDVVVRVLLPEAAARPHARAAFLDLGKRAYKMVHQNLVHTIHVQAHPECRLYFVVRDYVDAPTLQSLRDQKKSFTIPEVIDLMRQVLEALSPAHRQGTAHGGVKPSNLFCYPDGRILLGDPSLPPQGGDDRKRLAYDYRYAAPETFRGDGAVGPAGDQYALGCAAYELLCGAPPFVSDNPYELGAMHTRDAVTPPDRRGAYVGSVGSGVLLKLLAREPGGRFPSVKEALAAVEGWRASLTVCVPTPPAPPPVRPDVETAMQAAAAPPSAAAPQRYATLNSIVPAEESLPQGTMAPEGESPRPAGMPQQIGRYQVRKLLGAGGFGAVYLAFDPQLQRTLALKVLRPEMTASAQALERFVREARAVARLLHPNIVPVFDAGRDGALNYIASAFIQGRTLADLIPEGGMEPRRAANLAIQLLEALAYAHKQGVLHRDVKPQNAMIDDKDGLYLMDFGLAGLAGQEEKHLTMVGAVMGTPAFMAPEQASGDTDRVGPASDQYGAGVVLYKLLTGRLPFEGSALRLLHQVMTQPPPPPSQHRPGLDPALEAICLKAIAKNPEKRFASCGEFADALRRFLADQARPDDASPE